VHQIGDQQGWSNQTSARIWRRLAAPTFPWPPILWQNSRRWRCAATKSIPRSYIHICIYIYIHTYICMHNYIYIYVTPPLVPNMCKSPTSTMVSDGIYGYLRFGDLGGRDWVWYDHIIWPLEKLGCIHLILLVRLAIAPFLLIGVQFFLAQLYCYITNIMSLVLSHQHRVNRDSNLVFQ